MPARRPVEVTDRDRATLRSWSGSGDSKRRLALRAQIILLAAQGLSDSDIARSLGISRPAVMTWRARYAQGGLMALADRPRSGRPRHVTAGEIVACTLRTAPRLRSATSCARWVAAELGVSAVTVSRAWRLVHLNVSGSGAVLYESEPPVLLSEHEILAVCVRGTRAVAIARRVGRGATPRGMQAGHTPVSLRRGCVDELRHLLSQAPADEPLTAIVVGNGLGVWSGLEVATGEMGWHLAPSVQSWLAVVAGMSCAATAPVAARRTRAGGHEVADELDRLLTTPLGARGWSTWLAA
jgi:transposase